ncbi:Na+/H+ antiporter subunit E [Roseivivax sp. CAU 1761]
MTRLFRRILPHPYLSILLALTYCILTNSFGVNAVVLGVLLGILIPQVSYPYWPDAPRHINPWKMFLYSLVVIWDIFVANVVVAWIVLTRSNSKMRSMWVVVPLDIRTPEAITILAGTITLTPGTVSADLSSEGHSLLVHALDADSPEAVRDDIKRRYERRLKEIFE